MNYPTGNLDGIRAPHTLLRSGAPSLLLLLLGLLGCTGKQQGTGNDAASLAEQVAILRIEVDSLQSRFKSTEEALFSRWREEIEETKATLTPTSQGFQVARTSVGTFLISVVNVTEYAGGSRVTLSVGNPLSAEFENTEFRVTYKRKSSEVKPSTADGLLANYQHLPRLRGGTWSQIVITLPEVTPENLGEFAVAVHPGSVFLASQPGSRK